MPSKGHVMAIDQGTTSTRALIFDGSGVCVAAAQKELTQHFPQPAWVEHDAEEIFRDAVFVMREALRKKDIAAGELAAIGLTNQRETVLLWDRKSQRALGPAIDRKSVV